jgi:hypothetical protein
VVSRDGGNAKYMGIGIGPLIETRTGVKTVYYRNKQDSDPQAYGDIIRKQEKLLELMSFPGHARCFQIDREMLDIYLDSYGCVYKA